MNGSAKFQFLRRPRSGGFANDAHAGGSQVLEAFGASRPGAREVRALALGRKARECRAFTLAELLVVIVIMGILAGLTVPGIRSMSRSNATSAADRQLLDDLAYARQRAIAQHTTVYVMFVPPNLGNTTVFTPLDPGAGTVLSNLYGGRFTTYALMSLRSVGEQPGQAHPRYLTAWRSLPEGVFIATNKFRLDVRTDPYYNDPLRRMFSTTNNFLFGNFLFPVITNSLPDQYKGANVRLPYLAFDYRGQLLSGRDEYIPLAPGSVAFPRGTDGNYLAGNVSVLERPAGNTMYDASYPNNAFNQIHIDWLTGRARVEKAEIR